MRRLICGVSALAATSLLFLSVATSAVADSPLITVKTNGVAACTGQWFSSSNPDKFILTDKHVNNHYCYIKYDWDTNLGNGYRINDAKDRTTPLTTYVTTTGHSTIYWQLCEEESGGPDVCQPQRADTT